MNTLTIAFWNCEQIKLENKKNDGTKTRTPAFAEKSFCKKRKVVFTETFEWLEIERRVTFMASKPLRIGFYKSGYLIRLGIY